MSLEAAVQGLKENRPVFSTEKQNFKTLPRGTNRFGLEPGEYHILQCYLAKIYKVAFNHFPNFRNVGDRTRALQDLANKYRNGYPWANNQRMKNLATPVLVSYAEVLAKQLEDIEKVKYGRDLGHVD